MSPSRIRVALLALCAGAGARLAPADEPRFDHNEGHLAVVEHDGSNYEKTLADGSINSGPRERIVREFLESHGDFYDFIVIFTNFDFSRGESTAFYLPVFNETQGLGLETFDNRARFGSTRLQGVIDMGPIAQYRAGALSVDPSDPRFRATLGTLAHEVGHRFVAHARYRDGSGEIRTDLLGRDQSHWSFLLGSDASFMYGSLWRENGNGTYTAVEVESRYSALDLYLMGLLAPEEVPPLTLLRNPEVDVTRIPELGATVAATEERVLVDQIVSAEGPRSPDDTASQKEFTAAFVFLTQRDIIASAEDVADVETIRSAFITTFFSLTLGRGFVDTRLFNVTPPDPDMTPDTARALDWLLGRQGVDGRWEDDPRTAIRDTSVVVSALEALGIPGEALAAGQSFLAAQTPASVYGLSRVLPEREPPGPAPLLALQNRDGGFGLAASYPSTALDTAFALEALTRMKASAPARKEAARFLLDVQRADGLWSSIGVRADLLATYQALRALAAVKEDFSDLPIAPAVQRALAALVSRGQLDGGFGDGPSVAYATAWAVEVLLDGGGPAPVVDSALDYLRKTQRPDGSWNGSAFQTATVLQALVPSSLPNLAITSSDVVVEPDPPEVGETAEVEVRVRNRGRVGAGSFFVQLFDGDPEIGGVPIGDPFPLPGLAAGATALATFSWDTGLEGAHTLFAVADLAGEVIEVSKLDNVATRETEVLPLLPNLVIEELAIAPASPAEGRTATLTARAVNRGTVPSPASRFRFHFGVSALGIVLAESTLPDLAAGESATLEAIWDTAGQRGNHRIHAVVDAENDVRERSETDNARSLDVVVRPPLPVEPDLVVQAADLRLEPFELTRLPENVRLRASIANTGTTAVDPVRVELFQGNPATGGVELDEVLTTVSGDSRVEVSFDFNVASGGTRAYFVVVDGDFAVAERDETNNAASVTLVDRKDTVEVELVAGSLTLSASSLTAGEILTVRFDVANRGTRSLASAPVALFFEEGSPDNLVLASSLNLTLEAGTVSPVTLLWKTNRVGTIHLRVKADPANVLGEVDETNNQAVALVDVLASTDPNLVVGASAIDIIPPSPLEGQSAKVSARVRNVGTVDAGAFQVGFFAGDPEKDGIPLGSVPVFSLVAGGEVTLEVTWPDVTLRGQELFFVVVDTSDAVPEFDEGDNRAFKVASIVGLPDLLATEAQLRLEPAFARAGETVSIEASFTNAGEQDATSFDVSLRLDDPVGGDVLGGATGVSLSSGETFSFSASWDTTGLAGDHALFLVLDGAGAVREQREDNNTIRVPASVQDADVFVTPLYFSPNGDGVQDQAAFFYRVNGVSEVSVFVLDSDQVPVRELLPSGGANGSAVWDGRNDTSVVSPDGEYFFVVSSDAGEIVRRRVVLDTNRSSLVEALGTPYTAITNLTCPLPGGFRTHGPVWLPDDSAALFIVRVFDPLNAPDFPPGLYRVSADGAVIDTVAQGAEFEEFFFHRFRSVSPDGKKVLLDRTTFPRELHVLDLETGARKQLTSGEAHASWAPEGGRLLVAEAGGLFLYDGEGDLIHTLSSDSVAMAAWSPGGNQIVYWKAEDTRLRLIRPDGTEDVEVPGSDVRDLASLGGTTYEGFAFLDALLWSRDGKKLYFTWSGLGPTIEESVGLLELTLATGEARLLGSVGPFLNQAELSFDQRWLIDRPFPSQLYVARRFDGREARPIGTSTDLRDNVIWSYRGTAVTFEGQESASPEACPGPDVWAIRSLLNGSADLRLAPLPSNFGVRITGTAADLNLDAYVVEFAPLATPELFTPVQPPSNVPVVSDLFTTWLPPAPGDYLVRLRVRDRAGNDTLRLERIFWDRTLPISGLRRSPEHISPNGDGVQDQALFEYTVLEPVNLEFHVRDETGRTLRTIPRDERALGRASFTWDGNDDGRNRVPDGVYTVEVRGAELRVVVDTTPPDVTGSHTDLYTSSRDPSAANLVADLLGHVRERNLVEWTLSDAQGEVLLSRLQQVGADGSDAVILESGPPFPGKELRASDFAGNVTVVPISGPAREVRLVNEFEILKTFGLIYKRGIGPFEPGPAELQTKLTLPLFSTIHSVTIGGIPFPVPPTETVLGWTARSSFPHEGLVFRYRKSGDPAFVESPAPRGRFALAAKDLEFGQRYEAHFAAEGVKSQDLDIVVGPDAVFVTAEREPNRVVVRAFSTYDEELVEATLFMSRNGAVTPLRVYRPFPGDVTEIVPIIVSCLDDLSFYMIARSADGVTRPSTTPRDYPLPSPEVVDLGPCGGVVDAQAQNQSACDAFRPEEVLVHAEGRNLPSIPTAITLLAEGSTLPRTEVARVENPPFFGRSASARLTWDVSALDEGFYTLQAQFFFADGTSFVGEAVLQIYLDQSPPLSSIESPLEGGFACVRTIEGKEFIEVSAVGRDLLVKALGIETLGGDLSQSAGFLPEKPLPQEIRQRLLLPIPTGFEGDLTLRLTVAGVRIPTESGGRPPMLGEQNAPPLADDNGSLLGCALRTVRVVRTEALGPLSAEPAFFSPNFDRRSDEVVVRGDLSEAATVTARVVRAAGGPTVRTLVADQAQGAGPFLFTWDGKNDAGDVLGDGRYRVTIDAVTGCGALSTRSVSLELDATKPVAAITSPVTAQPVAITVGVEGTAADQNFLQYVLEAGAGDPAPVFTPISDLETHQVKNRPLGVWDVGALTGPHTLRLVVEDKAGNVDTAEVVVDVRSPDLIEKLAATPALFSPNSDSVNESSEIAFRLKRESRVTLEIRDLSDNVVRKPFDDALLVTGDHTFVWDGTAIGSEAPDGAYRAVVLATDATLPALREEASISLTLDRIAPALRIDGLTEGAFVPLPLDLIGAVTDPLLAGFQVEVGPESGALEVLASGSESVTGVLARFEDRPDDRYRLKLSADDLAGNANEISLLFAADSTAPALSLAAPEEGAFLARGALPVRVQGSVTETSLENYLLEFGLGSPPRSLVPLAGGPSIGPEGVAADWAIADFPDGVYTLKLSARDRAQNSSELLRQVTLDGAPPTVAIDEPPEGGFVTGPRPITGTAFDTNLSGALLEVAPGPVATAFQFTELGRLAASVQAGELHSGPTLEDGDYTLRLLATDRAGNQAAVLRGFTLDTHPPQAPALLVAEVENRTDVRLRWAPNPEPDLAGYFVFRGTVQLNDTPIAGNELVDVGRPEGVWVYTVRAVDRAGLVSDPSAPADALIDLTPPRVALVSPEHGASIRGLVDVVGTAFAENDFQEYRLTFSRVESPESPTLLRRSPVPESFATLFQWDATLLEGSFILRLEAEDTRGNVGSAASRVTVDNRAPSPPVLSSVTTPAEPDDVDVVWQEVVEPDVAGYIVFRNRQVANAPGPVTGDLSPFLVPGPKYSDANRPDGRFCYRVAAMDGAGNLSADSNEICIVLDNRVPAAILFDPEDGARFDAPRQVRAFTEDLDVASVRFEYQPEGAPAWTELGIAAAPPFEALWDIAGLAFGTYRLRAIAADAASKSDPAPRSIGVVLADVSPPPVPTNLTAPVTGDDIALSWASVTAADLDSYRLYRDGALVATLPAPATTADQLNRPDGLFRYEVTSFDTEGNESARSEPATARVYQPSLPQVFPIGPIYGDVAIDVSGAAAEPDATVRLRGVGIPDVLAETTADASGAFVFEGLSLPEGLHRLEATATDPVGNVSRISETLFLLRDSRPATPEAFEGVAVGGEARLDWTANTELDLSGYHLRRDGNLLVPEQRISRTGDFATTLTATAASQRFSTTGPEKALDGNTFTRWESVSRAPFEPQWLQIEMNPPRHLRQVRINFSSPASRDYRILAELSGIWVPLVAVRGNTSFQVLHRFPLAPRIARLQISITALTSPGGSATVSEVELWGEFPKTGTSAIDTPGSRGTYAYTLTAVDALGLESAPAGPLDLGVGDLLPPEAPTNLVATPSGPDVDLLWTASVSPDAVAYRIYRDGAAIADVLETSHRDGGLGNGVYIYQVTAVDAVGNESAPSNEAAAEVAVPPPDAPSDLAVAEVPEGRALDLTWSAASGPFGVTDYVVLRATVSGGPYVEAGTSNVTTLGDRGLANGTEYFYVVRARDPFGNVSSDSNEASGVPRDTVPPTPPVLVHPTVAGAPVTLFEPTTDVAGTTEPGASVELTRNGEGVGNVLAEATTREERSFPLGFADASDERSAISSALATVALASGVEVRLHHLMTGVSKTIAMPAGLAPAYAGLAFSPDGKSLALALRDDNAFEEKLVVLDLESGSSEVFTLNGEAGWPAFLSSSEVAVGEGRKILALDVGTGARRELHTASFFFDRPKRLLLSKDGSELAFFESSSGLLKVLPLAGGIASTVSGDTDSKSYVWTEDGKLAFTDSFGLNLYDVGARSASLVPETENTFWPRRLSDGRLSIVRDPGNALELLAFDGSSVEELGVLPIERFAVGLFDWSEDARLAVHDDARLAVFLPAGRFELSKLSLDVGANALAATTRDEAGNESAHSEAVEVSFDPGRLPDLAPSGELLVVPAVPTTGQSASLALLVKNRGNGSADPAVVRATGVDRLGNVYTIGTGTTPPLASGASGAVSFLWDTTGRVGIQEVVVQIDPLRSLDESDETNNFVSRSVTVVATSGISLTVSTGLSSYGANQDVEIDVLAVNGGPDRAIRLETLVETASGLQVARVDVRSAVLAYAASSAYDLFWNTGTTLGGDYRVRVNALEADVPDVAVATATADFSIRRSVTLEAAVVSDRPSYPQGSSIALLGKITHKGGNSALRDLTVRFRVADGTAQVLFEHLEGVPYLAMGGSLTRSATWVEANPEPGVYRAALDVFESGAVEASASSLFRVTASTELDLSGALELETPTVPAGSDVVARFRVKNEGVLPLSPLSGGVVRAEMVDPTTGAVVVSREIAADIAPGQETEGEIRLPTTDLALVQHTVLLSAGEQAAPRLLDSRLVRIFGVPVAPSLNSPAEGASTAAPARLSVNNGKSPNGEPLTYDFEIYLDAALQFQLASASGIPEATSTTTWEVPVSLEENRLYFFRARARDRFAASDWMPPASFLLDSGNDPPGAPVLSAPAEATQIADLTPTLEVGNGVDPEGASLTYTFEVATDPDMTEVVSRIAGAPEGAGRTSVATSDPLEEDRTYFWRSRAHDGELDSEWMPTASFHVDTANHPPSAPLALRPIGGSSSAEPDLVTSLATDPEGDPVTYSFEIDRSPAFDSPEIRKADGVLARPTEVRWTVPVALAENVVYYWRARATDGTATGDWSPVVSFRVDQSNEPPSVPRLQSPTGGTLVSSVTPTLVVVNALDPEEDPLTYDFEVYEDLSLTTLFAAIATLREGESETAWVVSPRLSDDKKFYWRARARDGSGAGSWSLPESFRVNVMNVAPSPPALDSPADGSQVRSAPLLTVSNAGDPDGDALTYRFELYSDEMLRTLVAASDEVPEADALTSWQVPVAPIILEENALYYWRARARDPELEGSFMPTARFRFTEQNEPPGPPIPVAPPDGAESDTKTPILVVANAKDPEADVLRYLFEVATSPSFQSGVVTSPPQDEGTGETSWPVTPDLTENVTYYWRAFATDGSLVSLPSDVRSFRVNAVHDPPTVPAPLAPPDGGQVPSTLVQLVVQNAVSPDGFALRYHFAIASDAAFQTIVAEDEAVAEGNLTTAWDVPVPLSPGETYFWKVRAIDEGDVAGDFSASFQFEVILGTACLPVWDEDFESFAPGAPPSGFSLRVFQGSPFFSVSWEPSNQFLRSESSGEGALVFTGSGESSSWKNYSFQGELSVGESEDDDDDDDDEGHDCTFDAGLVFYSNPSLSSHYRLELSESCEAARLVKVLEGVVSVLAEAPVPFELDDDDEPLTFRIEVVSDVAETVIRAHLFLIRAADDDDGELHELWLEASDAESPLYSGTVGAWSRSFASRWNDFLVEELSGHESGISGDEDRDGVCDVDQACPSAQAICLDEGFQSTSGLSLWVTGRSGATGHSGPTACSAQHSYFVRKKTGVLQVEAPSLEGATYEFQLLMQRGTSGQTAPNLRVVFETGAMFDFSDPESPAEGPLLWTSPVRLELPASTLGFQIRSIGDPPVHVEAYRLKKVCEP